VQIPAATTAHVIAKNFILIFFSAYSLKLEGMDAPLAMTPSRKVRRAAKNRTIPIHM
jgi:hypothetical protein